MKRAWVKEKQRRVKAVAGVRSGRDLVLLQKAVGRVGACTEK